ncbi:10613_t:CDS:2 [Acaulospora morrowiae]|uniref:10613_t:CDS:1 n=1 Tax=Acaulospora morrowiae TaxID=94023 RepID=A0A9N9GJ46_9GLOM|nr:10613_t:CDS:2 [Acaulospora morrowiae]
MVVVILQVAAVMIVQITVVDANLLPNSLLNMTVQSPYYGQGTEGTSALGHFYMHIDNKGGGYRFLKRPIWVNGCQCSSCENISSEFTSLWQFDLPTPPIGTGFDIWIAIYWDCYIGGIAVSCKSENVHYRGVTR